MHRTMKQWIAVSLLFVTAGCSKEPTQPIAVTEGEKIVKGTCKVCHAQGINGAPIIGNQKMWGPRIAQGKEVLVQHAINGYGLMPAKGGNDTLSRNDIENAISYMLAMLKQ